MNRSLFTWLWFSVVLGVSLAAGLVRAQTSGTDNSAVQESDVNKWLMRMHEASRQRAYTGTFVVSAGPKTATARIWHICDGVQQMERVEPLSGPPRSTFRRNDQVVTFFPENKVAVAESRESLGLFPNFLKSGGSNIGAYYTLKGLGAERLVGVDTDIVQLLAKDKLRYSYRIWTEKRSGLVVQLQTLDLDGHVLEQAAFSELQMDAPVSMAKLSQMMAATQGYKIERPELQKTSADAQGWAMRNVLAGFTPAGCYLRSTHPDNTMQWMFSDGLANVSLFVENFDARRHVREGVSEPGGATRSVTRRLDGWWLTAMGEVPVATLNTFVQALERKK